MLDDDTLAFEQWLTQQSPLDMASRLSYEFGDPIRYTAGSIHQEGMLYKILFAAYNAGLFDTSSCYSLYKEEVD